MKLRVLQALAAGRWKIYADLATPGTSGIYCSWVFSSLEVKVLFVTEMKFHDSRHAIKSVHIKTVHRFFVNLRCVNAVTANEIIYCADDPYQKLN